MHARPCCRGLYPLRTERSGGTQSESHATDTRGADEPAREVRVLTSHAIFRRPHLVHSRTSNPVAQNTCRRHLQNSRPERKLGDQP